MRNLSPIKSPRGAGSKIKVLLYARFRLVQECLQSLLEASGEIIVINAPHEIEELISTAQNDKFDLLILSLINNNDALIEIIPNIHETVPEARIMVITSTDDIKVQFRSVQLGAVGVMQFEQGKETMLRAIKQIHGGETSFNQKLMTELLHKGASKGNGKTKDLEIVKQESLTNREREVISLIGLAMSNKEIARKLCISEATVRHHLSSIYSKLGMEDRLNLVIYAYQHQLFEPFSIET